MLCVSEVGVQFEINESSPSPTIMCARALILVVSCQHPLISDSCRGGSEVGTIAACLLLRKQVVSNLKHRATTVDSNNPSTLAFAS